MTKEAKIQAKVAVGLKKLWKIVCEDLVIVTPKIIPTLVKEAHVIEGDTGLGTVIHFTFAPDVAMTYQKEKIVELDESLHLIALEVVEGGHLELGFSSYKTIFQFTAIGEDETLVDITVAYEYLAEASDMPKKTTNSALFFIKCLENYLLNATS